MIKLDDRDIKILAVLQVEGRISKTALADRVNLSATACWERLKRLESSGLVEGYGARLSLSALGPYSVIFMQAEIANHSAEDFNKFECAVDRMPEIVECWAVAGGVDYFLKFVCEGVDTYQRLVDEMLQSDIGLHRYFTYVVTKPIKCMPSPSLAALAKKPNR